MNMNVARILCAAALAFLCAPAGAPAAPAPMKATLTFLKGIARVQTAAKQTVKAELGRVLLPGETILTLDNTRVEIKLENGSILRLGSNTTFTLQSMERTSMGGIKGLFKVAKGRMWFTVGKLTGDSEIKTQSSSVVAAVKGTVYRMDAATDGKTDVVVYDGVVAASREGEPAVDLKPMEKLAAMPNAAFERGPVNEADEDKDDWVRWNKTRDKLRIMIILPEKRDGEKATASFSENAAMKRFLNNYLFKLVEKDQADKIRESEKLKAAVRTNDAAAIAAAGLEVAADLIIVGEAVAKPFKGNLGGLVSVSAVVNARAVRADTAEVIAANPGIITRGLDITDESAAQKALVTAGERMASEFIDAILLKWRQEVKKGASLDVVVDGVDYKTLKTVTNALAKIEGVKDVQSLYLVGRRSLLNVGFAGDSTGLADRIEEAKFGTLKVGVVGLSAYRVELEVSGGVAAPVKKNSEDAVTGPADAPDSPAAASDDPETAPVAAPAATTTEPNKEPTQ